MNSYSVLVVEEGNPGGLIRNERIVVVLAESARRAVELVRNELPLALRVSVIL